MAAEGDMIRFTVTPKRVTGILARVDWDRVNAMTEEAVDAARRADPDALPPMTDAEVAAEAAAIRRVRERTGLDDAGFAAAYGIPLPILRAWEAGEVVPDAAARTYLRVIEREPALVARVLAA